MVAVRSKKAGKAKSVIAQKPKSLGWNTSDQDEIALRRWRGETEPMRVQSLESEHPVFGAFSVQSSQSSSAQSYHVEIRCFSTHLNSCDCPDYQYNGLGVCKHIEKVLWTLRRQKAEQNSSPRIEIFLDRRDQRNRLCVQWPVAWSKHSAGKQLLEPFFSSDGSLLEDPLTVWPSLRQAMLAAKPAVRNRIRVSSQIEPFLQAQRRLQQQRDYKTTFLHDIEQGKRDLNVVKHPLYPYQQEGMLHLALNERALLGDEMGLGKTVQAIAACELLRRVQGIKTVLVVATASLKTEWEEQIKQFVELPYLIITGHRGHRLLQYRRPAFFYLTNYEQILSDAADIQKLIAPDVIILDEAQRIKNWQTKTAHAIKQLHSRFAFVLTGTPLENRIDDIYSIVQFLDPAVFGPLFRFNRDFYELNDQGKPVAYKNLDQLHQRLRPILLRRRKQEVEKDLPPCSLREYFVDMTEEQSTRYEEYEKRVVRLVKIAERRPLTPEEYKQLQQYLACMRMVCDTPYILDPNCRDCPKLIELENILEELLTDSQTKILIFSEWERMLQLVRELAQKMGFGAAWHTGSVPQTKRRQEINRFKQDPHCRLFLSTDSGSVGLNLQAANVVINLDLPWNPAKLAQRIARAWRKHQHRHVQVIHLITNDSIEHRMTAILNHKQTLAQGVLHGDNNLRTMELPSGRKAFIERLNALLTEPTPTTPPTPPIDAWNELPSGVCYLGLRESDTQPPVFLAVAEQNSPEWRNQVESALTVRYPQQTPAIEYLDRETFALIQRLSQAGLLTLHPQVRPLYESKEKAASTSIPSHWRNTARQKQQQAERPLRLAETLISGQFYPEALTPLREAVELLVTAAAWTAGLGEALADKPVSTPQIQQLITQKMLPPSSISLVTFLRENSPPLADAQLQTSLKESQALQMALKNVVQIIPSPFQGEG